jgi:hypothetical protein
VGLSSLSRRGRVAQELAKPYLGTYNLEVSVGAVQKTEVCKATNCSYACYDIIYQYTMMPLDKCAFYGP